MLPILLVAATLASAAPDPNAAPVIAAERAFAADAQRLGIRLAFLAHFDAGAFVFRPAPVPALPALARDPDDGTQLQWGPDFVGVAASGELAFSSGPWRMQQAGHDGALHGHFVTLWKRGPDGIWRVQADTGISHAAPERASAPVSPAPAIATRAPADAGERRAQLERADDALRAALERKAPSALADEADPSLHVLREGAFPADGPAALALVAKDAPGLGRGPRQALDVAASGEFGYTLGGAAACSGCGSYLRVWRWSDGRWRVLVDASMAQP
jgi:hypothetical protein